MSCVSISQGCRQVVFLLSNKAAWRALGRWPLATFAGRICQRHGTLSPTTSTDNLHRRKQARSLMQQWLQASPNRRYLLCWHWRTTSIPRLPRAIDAAFARWHGPPPHTTVHGNRDRTPAVMLVGNSCVKTEAGVQGDSPLRHSRSIRIILWLNPENYSHPWMRRKKFKD